MKTTLITISICLAALFFSCKSSDSVSKQESIARITEKVENRNFAFVPRTALPMGGKSINISYGYSLKVSQDSIIAYLPYYGRAYSAPTPGDNGGIKFTSTDFEYLMEKKNNGMWDAVITIKDNRNNYKLMLQMGNTGYGSLTVQDNTRQSITFNGQIE